MIPIPNLSDPEREHELLRELLQLLRNAKPDDRSNEARYYQVCITDIEKVLAFHAWNILIPSKPIKVEE